MSTHKLETYTNHPILREAIIVEILDCNVMLT